MKEKLENEVTKVKEKLEKQLTESNKIIRENERIIKGIKSMEKEDKKMIKILSYVSKINKNKKENIIITINLIRKYAEYVVSHSSLLNLDVMTKRNATNAKEKLKKMKTFHIEDFEIFRLKIKNLDFSKKLLVVF